MATLREAAEQLSDREEKGSDLEKKFDDIDEIETDSVIQESELRKKIEGDVEPGKVAGVDGGIVRKRYSSADIVAVRAVAAVFDFTGSKVTSEYLPGKSPEPDFSVLDPQDQENLDRTAEAKRLKAETEIAMSAQAAADTVMMDGSIVPSYSGDEEVMENYHELFENAESGKIVGVVEDSYGTSLTSMLEEKTGIELGDMRDTQVMDAILSEGERSFVRKYSKGPAEHPVIKKMAPDHVNRIHTFYLKLSSKDRPLRIDYYGEVEDADRIASLLFSIKSSESYTIPSPVVGADKRAKVPENYIKRLEKRFSPDEKRRDRRSF